MSVIDQIKADAKEISLGLPMIEATIRTFVSGFEQVQPRSENAARLLIVAVVSFVVSAALTLFQGDRLGVLLFLAKVQQGLERQMEVIANGEEVVETKPYNGAQS
jgi:uncharacterized membrane protein